MTTPTGGPAFPSDWYPPGGCASQGMDLRDYFAAKAMQALISKMPLRVLDEKDSGPGYPKPVAIGAYDYADAMIAERAKHG